MQVQICRGESDKEENEVDNVNEEEVPEEDYRVDYDESEDEGETNDILLKENGTGW